MGHGSLTQARGARRAGGWTAPSPRPGTGTPPSAATATAPAGSRARPWSARAGAAPRRVRHPAACVTAPASSSGSRAARSDSARVDVHRGHPRPAPALERPHLVESGRRQLERALPRRAGAASRPSARGRRPSRPRSAGSRRDRGPRRRCATAATPRARRRGGRAGGGRAGTPAGGRGRSRTCRGCDVHTSTRPLPDRLLGQRDRAVVEARQHAVLRLQRPVAEEARGGEVAAARAAEQLEHRVRVVEVGERRRPSPRSGRRRRRTGRAAGRRLARHAPAALCSPRTTSRPAALLHELAQPPRPRALGGARRSGRPRAPGARSSGAAAARPSTSTRKRGRWPMASARRRYRLRPRGAPVLRGPGRGRRRRARARSGTRRPGRARRAVDADGRRAPPRAAEGRASKVTVADGVRAQARALLAHGAPVHLERDVQRPPPAAGPC